MRVKYIEGRQYMSQAARPKANAAGEAPVGRRASRVMRRLLRRAQAIVDDTSGATVVEFAIVVWPFLIMVFGALQLSLIVFMDQMLQTAAVHAGRQYMTGNAATAPDINTFKTNYVLPMLPGPFNPNLVMVDVHEATTAGGLSATEASPPAYTVTCSGTPSVCNVTQGNFTASSPSQYAIVRVMYQASLMGGGFALPGTSGGAFMMAGTAVFRVEPYSS